MSKMANIQQISSIILSLILLLPVTSAQQSVDNNIGAGVTPDSFLWGLDKAIDQLSLILTFDRGEKAKKGLEIAKERLLEVKAMVEENKFSQAEKAKEAHARNLIRLRQNVGRLSDDTLTEEIMRVVEIEKGLEDHNEEIEQTLGELKIKIKIKGEDAQDQLALIDSILNSLQEQTGEVEIEIKNKKDEIKVKIKQETKKPEEEIALEIEDIEKSGGVKKREKALEAIEDAEEELAEVLREAEEKNIAVSEALIADFNSLLEQAITEFDSGNFIEAKRFAKQAESLLDDKDEELEEDEREIEVEIEEGKAKVKVEIGKEELKFEVDDTNLETIVNKISTMTGLSIEEINSIIKVKIEEEEEELEVELEAESKDGKTKVKTEVNGKEQRFILESSSIEEVVKEIMARTGLSEEEVKANLKFNAEEKISKKVKRGIANINEENDEDEAVNSEDQDSKSGSKENDEEEGNDDGDNGKSKSENGGNGGESDNSDSEEEDED